MYGSRNTLRYAYVIPIESSTLSSDRENISPTQASHIHPTFSISIDDDVDPVETLLENAYVIHPPVRVNITDISSAGHKTPDNHGGEEKEGKGFETLKRNRTVSGEQFNISHGIRENSESTVTLAPQQKVSVERDSVNRTENTNSRRLQIADFDDDELRKTNSSRGRVLLDPFHRAIEPPVKIGSQDGRAREIPRLWPEVASLEGNPGKIIMEGEGSVPGTRVDLSLESGETRDGKNVFVCLFILFIWVYFYFVVYRYCKSKPFCLSR